MHAKRIVKNTCILYLRLAISLAISLYSTRLILAALGANDFGIFSVVSGAILMLGFLNNSMSEATQRFISIAYGNFDVSKVKQVFNISMMLHFKVAIILFGVLEIGGWYLFNFILNISLDRIEVAKIVYQFLVVSTMFSVLSVPYDAVINARENMSLFAVIGILESVFKFGIALAITNTNGDRLVEYGILMSILPVFLFLIRALYCRYKYSECKVEIGSKKDKRVRTEMRRFASWSFLSSFTSMMTHYGQSIVLNIFFGPIVNAAQAIATQTSGQLGTLSSTLIKAINPTITKSEGAGDRGSMIKFAFVGSKVSFFLLMFLYVPVLIEMKFVFKLWLIDVPPYTIIFCQLLLLRNLIEQLFFTLITSIYAVGRIKQFQIIGSLLWCLPLLVSYLMFENKFPPFTMYYVFIIYSIMSSVNILYFSNKLFQLSLVRFFKDVILRCILSFAVSLFLSSLPLLFVDPGINRLMLVIGLGIISFFISVWFIGFTRGEKHFFKRFYYETVARPIIFKIVPFISR